MMRDRLGAIAANLFGDLRPQQREGMESAAHVFAGNLVAALGKYIAELTPRSDARTAVFRGLAQDGRDHRVSSHAGRPHTQFVG